MSEARNCAAECGRSFIPPRKDPDRVMCEHCLRERGLPRLVALVPEEDRPVEMLTGVCDECGNHFVRAGDEMRCSVCKNLVHTVEDETPLPEEILEVDERPEPTKAGQPLFRRLSKQQCLDYAADLAADMETGYYIPPGETKPWPENTRFNIKAILLRMGYGRAYANNARRPAWWPKGGTQAFKGYVQWKIRERTMLGRVTYEKLVPYVEAVTFSGFVEIARRIHLAPEDIPFRDLSQFTMRGVEIIKGQSDPWKGAISPDGKDAFDLIGKALEGVGDLTARQALGAMLQVALRNAEENTRRIIEIPAKAG